LILKAAIKLVDVLIVQGARDIIIIIDININISVCNLRANKNNFDKDEIA